MTTQTQIRKYEMKGNPIFQEVPQIDNHRHDETRQEILAIHNERFRGDSRIADFNKYKKGEFDVIELPNLAGIVVFPDDWTKKEMELPCRKAALFLLLKDNYLMLEKEFAPAIKKWEFRNSGRTNIFNENILIKWIFPNLI